MRCSPFQELEAEAPERQCVKPDQLFVLLLQLKGGWGANYALHENGSIVSRLQLVAHLVATVDPRSLDRFARS